MRVISALALAAALLGSGCQDAPRAITVGQLHLKFDVPAELSDLTYRMGTSAEGQPAANLSTAALTKAGGPGCAAGATSSVSPYPIGQIVLTDETPAAVAEETKQNPEDVPGEFVRQVGPKYLYYAAPPAESCAPGNDKAAKLQSRARKLLRQALKTVTAGP